MNRRRVIIAIASVAVIGIGFVVWLSRTPPDPIYNGKPLSLWLTNYLWGLHQGGASSAGFFGTDRDLYSEADDAVRSVGTNGIPTYLRLLQSHDSALKVKLVEAAGRLPFVKIRFMEAGDKQIMASAAFAVLGSNAAPAVPELLNIYENNRDLYTRSCAARALIEIGPAAHAAIPALIRGVTNKSELLASRSVIALGDVATEQDMPVVLPVLTQLLTNRDMWGYAVDELESLGPRAKPALPALFELLKTVNNDPKKFRALDMPGSVGGLNGINMIICRLIRHIDPETFAARKTEIDAALSAADAAKSP